MPRVMAQALILACAARTATVCYCGLMRIRYDFDLYGAFARAVIFAQENTLPAAQNEMAPFDEDDLAGSGKDCFRVRIGIAFGVAVRAAIGDQPIHDSIDVGGDIGVGVLVNGYASRGMRDVHVARSLLNTGRSDGGLDFAGDVYELRAAVGAD